MKKQILTMFAVLTLVGTFAVTSANAQNSPYNTLTADIPFSFVVSGTTMPAGTYTVEHLQSPNVIRLRQLQGNNFAVTVGHTVQGERYPEAELQFNAYDNRYFLSEIWGFGSVGKKLNKSDAEREWAQIAASRQRAEVMLEAGRP